MMSIKLLLSTVVLLVSAIVANSLNEQEYEILDRLRQVEENIKRTNEIAATEFWGNQSGYAAQRITRIRSDALDLSNWLRQYDNVVFEDPIRKQQVKNLRFIGTFALQNDDWNNFETIIDHLKSTGSKNELCEFNRRQCNLSYEQHILNAIIRSGNPAELKHYWLEYVNKIGPVAKNWVHDYAEFYRKSADINGIHLPSYQHYYKFDNPNFSDEMHAVQLKLKGLITELHAYIRHSLYTKFGSSVLSERGPIPYHLLKKVIAGAWSTSNIVDQPFPYTLLPDMNRQLSAKRYDTNRIARLANNFLISIGLSDLPTSFWNQYTRQMTQQEAGNPDTCQSQVFDFTTTVALKYCPVPTYKTFLSMHGDMSMVHYTQKKQQLVMGLNEEPCPGFAKALSKAIMLSASSAKYKQRQGLIDNTQNYNTEMIINRLFHKALNTIFNIASNYVYDNLMVDILDGRLQPVDYNCEYWKLMNEYVGVEPADFRTSEEFDVPIEFYEGVDPKRSHVSKFVTEILGYQFYKGLCEASGESVRDLQNCDFFSNRRITNIVKDVYESGAKKTWRDTMQPITHVRQLSADALIDFYAPLYSWLVDYNNRNNVYRGWSKQSKCHNVPPGTERRDYSPEGIPYCN